MDNIQFWQTLDFWNFVIAVLALLAAFYSIWYTRQRDRASLEIVDTWYETPEGNPFFIGFTIFNNSSTAIRLTNVELLNQDGTSAHVLNEYEYKSPIKDQYLPAALHYDPFHQNSPFDREEIIPANTDTSFKYYLNPFSPDMKIKITADRPIHRWSKTKTFSVHFVKTD